MIIYTKGNILNADAEALINTVNTVGVMGKGIALQFKKSYQANFKAYEKAVKNNEVKIGQMFVTETESLINPKYIINFPTKKHWRYPSKLEFIESGLEDLVRVILERKIKSVAIPPLGAGNGGLDWRAVRSIISSKLQHLDIEIIIYEPSDIAYRQNFKKQLTPKEVKLTPVRAMVLKILSEYDILGEELTLLEAQKLVYFLQRMGENLKLNFSENYYGPYAEKLIHVLYDMDGHFLDGIKFKDIKPFEKITIKAEKLAEINKYLEENLSADQAKRLNTTLKLIYGFEFPLGMELLSTLDFVITRNKNNRENIDSLIEAVHKWSTRKKELMKPAYLKKAYSRLREYDELLYA